MSNWITPEDLKNSLNEAIGLPSIPINTQNVLRSKKKITYSKVGRNVVYKREWIEEYMEKNIRRAKAD